VAGALVFAAGNFDRRTSDWAQAHHPIFGTHNNAESASDSLLYALMGEAVLTAALTPRGDDPDWMLSKAKGYAVEGLAEALTSGIQSGTSELIQRTRPNGASGSFFSGHASAAFSSQTLANRNLDSIGLQDEWRYPLQAGNILLAGGVAWARVEGGNHFPTDVLVGAAVGHFVSAFVHDAFLGLPEDSRFHLEIQPNSRGAMVVLSIDF
jgi:membrane-associated phospholipid phosphatase